MDILLQNITVLPMTASMGGPQFFTGSVGISGGKIAFASPDREAADDFLTTRPAARVIDGRGKIVMPGLINTHCHTPMVLMRGYADDISLMSWLNDRVWPFEAKLTGDDIALGTELGISEMLLGGTTCFVDMYWKENLSAQVAARRGIRALPGATFFDSYFDQFLTELDELVKFSRTPESKGLITPMIAPHAPYSCSAEHIRRAMELCDEYGLGAMVHLAETLDEAVQMKERYNCTPAEYLESAGMFDRKTLAVHCVHLSDGDMDILARNDIPVAHNPQSNMKLASGIAPVARMMEKGIKVCIGTDGACSNNDLDMWDEMRTASFLAKVSTMDPCALPAYKVLEMATCDAAHAIGLGDKVGRIKPGMRADVIVIDADKPHLTPQHDPIANLVYAGHASDVHTVIVDGRILVENGRLLNDQTPVIMESVRRRAAKLARS